MEEQAYIKIFYIDDGQKWVIIEKEEDALDYMIVLIQHGCQIYKLERVFL